MIFSSRKNKVLTLIVSFLFILVVGVVFYFSYPYFSFLMDVESTRNFISGFGVLAPLSLILVQIVQVLFAPIPGQVIGLASGFLFGWFFGTLYAMIGVTIGSFIAIYLARKLGRPFVERVITKTTLKKFDYVMKDKGLFTIFLLFLLPAMPDDAICFIAGLTKVKIRVLVLLAVIGRFPGFLILNLVGDGIANSQVFVSAIIFSVAMVISLVVFFFRKELERMIKK